jgi:hypothetical protein
MARFFAQDIDTETELGHVTTKSKSTPIHHNCALYLEVQKERGGSTADPARGTELMTNAVKIVR